MTPWSTIDAAAVRAATKTPEVEAICEGCGRKLHAGAAPAHHGGMTKYHVIALGFAVALVGVSLFAPHEAADKVIPVATLIIGGAFGQAHGAKAAGKRDAAP